MMRHYLKTALSALLALLALAALLVFLSSFHIVRAGHRGVVLRWGAVTDEILPEGLHWRTPIVLKVHKIDVTVRKVSRTATAASRDLQVVTAKVAINYRLTPDRVNRIFQALRDSWEERVIEPSIEEFTKKTTAKFTAEELITKREIVKSDLKTFLAESLAKNDILLDDVFITDFNFSPTFNRAIEEKVTAEQEAIREKNKLEQKKYEAEQMIVKARAEAEAIRIQAQAITQRGGRDYVALRAIEKWNGQLPTSMIPGSALPFIKVPTSRDAP